MWFTGPKLTSMSYVMTATPVGQQLLLLKLYPWLLTIQAPLWTSGCSSAAAAHLDLGKAAALWQSYRPQVSPLCSSTMIGTPAGLRHDNCQKHFIPLVTWCVACVVLFSSAGCIDPKLCHINKLTSLDLSWELVPAQPQCVFFCFGISSLICNKANMHQKGPWPTTTERWYMGAWGNTFAWLYQGLLSLRYAAHPLLLSQVRALWSERVLLYFWQKSWWHAFCCWRLSHHCIGHVSSERPTHMWYSGGLALGSMPTDYIGKALGNEWCHRDENWVITVICVFSLQLHHI